MKRNLGWWESVLGASIGVALTACGGASTPVKFEACDASGKRCVVEARFDSFEACQKHRTFVNALCDSVSDPGTIVCRTCPGQAEGCTIAPVQTRCTK